MVAQPSDPTVKPLGSETTGHGGLAQMSLFTLTMARQLCHEAE